MFLDVPGEFVKPMEQHIKSMPAVSVFETFLNHVDTHFDLLASTSGSFAKVLTRKLMDLLRYIESVRAIEPHDHSKDQINTLSITAFAILHRLGSNHQVDTSNTIEVKLDVHRPVGL